MEWLVYTRQPSCNLNSNNFVNEKVLFSHFCAIILQAQAMKEQAQLREEMAYQYKLGNFEVRITNLTLFGLWLLAWRLSTKFAAIFITIGCCRNPEKVGSWCCGVVCGHNFLRIWIRPRGLMIMLSWQSHFMDITASIYWAMDEFLSNGFYLSK